MKRSLIEKLLIFCGSGGILLSIAFGILGVKIIWPMRYDPEAIGTFFYFFIPSTLGFAAGVACLAIAEILKHLRVIASGSKTEIIE